MRRALLLLLVACGNNVGEPKPTPPHAAPSPAPPTAAPSSAPATPRADAAARERLVAPEAFLRSYLGWFGDVPARDLPKVGGRGLFDQWADYLGALGLPDYRVDIPRAGQSNAIMVAAVGRLGEAMCVRAALHDLQQKTPLAQRQIFAFERKPQPTLEEFQPRFDVLHRTFLSYPVELAPADRVGRFYALYQKVEAAHGAARAQLTADEAAWAAVCTALVQHPEARIY